MGKAHELDNPVWASLKSRHRDLARCAGEVLRYPPDVAPFLGIDHANADIAEAVTSLLASGETVYLLGVAPVSIEGFSLKAYPELAQMESAAPLGVIDGPEIVALSEVHRADVLELTALVYPHYFRPCTMQMGRYFGIYREARLAAMIGERLGMQSHTEISAICTHPDFNGRGHARRLLAWLSNDNLEKGCTPFLHVSHQNHRALRMYEQLSYRHRRDIGFWSLRRG